MPLRHDPPRWAAYVRDAILEPAIGRDLLALAVVRRPALPKYTKRETRLRAAPPKLITLNNALVAAIQPKSVDDLTSDPERYGSWVENACLAHAWNSGQHVSYWREEPLEVDGVLEGSWGNWAIEVRTGGYAMTDLRGLLEFVRRHPSFRPLVICDAAGLPTAERAGVPAMTWQDYLVHGPEVAGR